MCDVTRKWSILYKTLSNTLIEWCTIGLTKPTCLLSITEGVIKQFVNICFPCRKLLETIDQSEFEGFEYVNPLLTSAEEAV